MLGLNLLQVALKKKASLKYLMNKYCSVLAEFQNNSPQLQLQDCGVTAGNKPH